MKKMAIAILIFGLMLTMNFVTFSFGENVLAAESEYPDWSDYKWACIGDSLTDTNISPSRKYETIIAEETGINVQMLGVGRSGYTAQAEKNNAFVDLCALVEPDTDIVTLFGSVNDWKNYAHNSLCTVIGTADDQYDNSKTWKENTFCANVNKTFDVLFAQAPEAKVIVFGAMPYYGVTQYHFKDARNAVESVCAARGIPYIDMFNATDYIRFMEDIEYAKTYTEEGEKADWKSTTDYPSSFGHPNSRAHEELIAPIFYEVLKQYLPVV